MDSKTATRAVVMQVPFDALAGARRFIRPQIGTSHSQPGDDASAAATTSPRSQWLHPTELSSSLGTPGQQPCGHRMEVHRTERALTHLTRALGDIHRVHSHGIAQSRLHGHLTPRGSLEQPSQVPCGGRGGTMVAQASVRSREGNACATLPDGQLLEWTHM